MIRTGLLLALLAALAAPGLAHAQNAAPTLPYCLSAAGKVVLCPLQDMQPAPGVTPPFTAPTAGQKAQVVAISPNGGGIAQPSALASYRAVTFGNAAYTTPQDLACLQNPATSAKTVYVTQFASLPQQTTSALQTFYFLKRTTLNTGGTSAAATSVAFDSADPAATASLLTYTGAPTAGTSAGALNQALVAVVATTQAPTLIGLFFESGGAGTNVNIPIGAALPNSNALTQPITLRAGEELCINFNGAALPSGFTSGYIAEWAER